MTIKLRKANNVWLADRVNDVEAKQLFGTTELPTPFMASVPAEQVQAEIQQLNPGDTVIIA